MYQQPRVSSFKEGNLNYVLIPGAWMGAWVWEPVTDGLQTLGHQVYTVTLPGLEDTAATPVADVTLQAHVEHVLSLLETHDLYDVIVVGHSYSGIVAGQVADRAPDRVVHTVYVDAFLPHDGRSLLDAFPESQREDELRQIAERGGRWPAPDVAGAADGHGLSVTQAKWLVERLVDHPGRTLSDPAVLRRPLAEQRATYIVCVFEESEEAAALRNAPTWTFRKLEAGHWPMVSTPDQLVTLLAEAASQSSQKDNSP